MRCPMNWREEKKNLRRGAKATGGLIGQWQGRRGARLFLRTLQIHLWLLAVSPKIFWGVQSRKALLRFSCVAKGVVF